MPIEVLRITSKNYKCCHFATPDTSAMLQTWTVTQCWKRGTRTFGYRNIICTKPVGFYFILFFQGSDSKVGH